MARPESAAAAVRVRFPGGKGREVSAAATTVDVRDVEKIEIEDERMDVVKYPKKKFVGDGTTTRLSGEDTSFGALIPNGKPVRVVAINPVTGIFSAPLVFVR